MYKLLGRFAAAYPGFICAGWVVLGLGLFLVAPNWDNRAQDDDVRFLPETCDSVRGYKLMDQAFHQDVAASRLIFAVERPDRPLSDADLGLVDDLVADLKRLKDDAPALKINRILYQRDAIIGKRLLSADNHCTLIQLALGTPYLALQTRDTADRADAVVRRRLAEVGGELPRVHTTGPAGVGRDLINASASSLEHTTLATVLLVVVVLLLVHRAPLLALVPLATIAISVFVALKLLALCTLIPGFYLVNVSQIFAVVMLYGAGTDYCLFLISRYREELAHGHDQETALTRSVSRVGGALAASAGTVICGLGMMAFAQFAKVRCGGPAIAISLAVALAASLTLTPALLRLLGKVVFWPGGLPRRRKEVEKRRDLWDRLSRVVVARPLLIWTCSVLLMLPLAVLGLQVKSNYRATGELAVTSSSVQGLDAIQKHFNAGEIGPITVLLESATDWDSKEGRAFVQHLSRGFAFLDNVAEVRSLTQPLGARPMSPPPPPETANNLRGNLFKAVWTNVVQGVADQVNRVTRDFYIAHIPGSDGTPHNVTRLDVVLRTDPFDPASVPTLDMIQLWLREHLPRHTGVTGEVWSECYGVTVSSRDLAEVTEQDRFRINALVLAGIFLILMALVRRPVLAIYLLLTVLFSYYATLGATTLAAHWWSHRPLGEVDWRVPFFLFTILVAVGEDYNILLITRALQERKRHGATEGLRRALACTGGTITSCGIIMAGTFATLMLAGLNTLVQIGFALAFGVLLDTFVVRPFLVPSLTLKLWQDQDETAARTNQADTAENRRPSLRRAA